MQPSTKVKYMFDGTWFGLKCMRAWVEEGCLVIDYGSKRQYIPVRTLQEFVIEDLR